MTKICERDDPLEPISVPALRAQMRDRVTELEDACRQARACLWNLSEKLSGPMREQMTKMAANLSKVLNR